MSKRLETIVDREQVELEAKLLRDAEQSREPVEPITDRLSALTVEDAYAIQLANVRVKIDAGDRIVGHKIGLTSRAMQEQLGVHQPDFGHLLASMAVENGGEVSLGELIQPRVEYEIAFVLGRDLCGPGVTVAEALAAAEAVFPSLEIIDSRIAAWRIQLADTIADAASSARFVLPSMLTSPAGLDLRVLGAVLEVNGVLVGSGTGAAVLGHPARCVAWLADALAPTGGLRAGQIVLAGALDRAVPIEPGDLVRAEFDHLGATSVRFVA